MIAVGRAADLAPWADIVYAADAAWWHSVGNLPGCAGIKVCLQEDVVFRDVRLLRHRLVFGLDPEPGFVATGAGNSGHQAINLAAQLGGRPILLLGFDMRPAADGRPHFFGRHPAGLNNPDELLFAAWRAAATTIPPDAAAMGTEVVNCSRETALDCFPRMTLDEALG